MMILNRTPARSSALSIEQLEKIAPSIFASAAHSSRSDRYAHIPTIAVLQNLLEHGFEPTAAAQARVRNDATRTNYTKHMVRLRWHGDIGTPIAVGDVFPEVILVNSHDGTSSYQLNAGLFRLVCGNGMVADAGQLGAVKVQHTGNVFDGVLSATHEVLDRSRRALDVAGKWSQLQLTPGEQNALAVGAHHLRFADEAGEIATPIQPSQFLLTRRVADRGNDLWTTFNRVQENTVRGGIRAWGQDANGRRRRVSSREVKGIDGNLNLNKALWKLAEALAAAKIGS